MTMYTGYKRIKKFQVFQKHDLSHVLASRQTTKMFEPASATLTLAHEWNPLPLPTK